MTPEAAHAHLFEGTLSCEATLRAGFTVRELAQDQVELLCRQAQALLAAIALVEDGRRDEEDGLPVATLRRMEAKLDLLLALMGRIMQERQDDTPPVPLRWSARGVRLPFAHVLPVGTCGLFQLQVTSWFPEPLTLPASVLASQEAPAAGAQLWLAFTPMTDEVSAALERHLFRLHRQTIAGRRRDMPSPP